jgi:hypothetical protein
MLVASPTSLGDAIGLHNFVQTWLQRACLGRANMLIGISSAHGNRSRVLLGQATLRAG